MKLYFAWGAGGAPPERDDDQNRAALGPPQALALLKTRLGLTRPLSNLPSRVAQFRALMEQADHPWYRESFTKDPWNTARQVLVLRDAAISAGWSAGEDATPSRLAALSAIESRITVGPARDPRATLAPGSSDDLCEILTALRGLAALPDSGTWPLGMDSIELLDDVADLPHEWQELLDLLSQCGVDIHHRDADRTGPIPDSLTIVRGQDEWSAAESAARFLACSPDDTSLVLVVTDDTTVLDQELHRRGRPTIGHPPVASADPASHLLPLFLSAVLPSLDVPRVAELLAVRLQPRRTDDAPQPVGLIPYRARTVLLNALVAEPGITSDPDSAWLRALDGLRNAAATSDDPRDDTSWSVAQTLDSLLRTAPPRVTDDRVAVDDVLTAVDWLAHRLRALGGSAPSRFVDLASAHITAFRDTLRLLGSTHVLLRELMDIVDACGPASTSSAHPAHAAPWTVVTEPAHIPPDTHTVLWWGAHSTDTPQSVLWDDDEAEVLTAQGARLTDPAQYERLLQNAALRGLAGTRHLAAFCPDAVSGTERRLHPALVHTADRYARARPDLFGETPLPVDSVLTHGTVAHPVADQCSDEGWSLGDRRLPVDAVDLTIPIRPERISRELDGDFAHLVPERLSYSQIDRLLTDPLDWTLTRGMKLTTGYGVQVPTGSRMIGLLVHAVVEHLVRDGAAAHGAVPTRDRIRTAFDRLVPRFAAELRLPGQRSRLNALRSTAVGSITGLFTALSTRGITVTAAEASFTAPLALTVADSLRDVELSGFRDLDGEFLDGRHAVLDLKWTRGPKRYRTAVDTGEAVQLSVYAHVLGTSAAGDPPLTAYYLLQQGIFVSSDRDLDEESAADGDPAHLWPRIQRSVEHALTRIATGRFDALAADAYGETGTLLGSERKPYNDRMTDLREAARTDGRLPVTTNQGYSDVVLIYGLTGDYS